ncbi:MAG TPA: beta-propeller fold lactonase family protein [Thermoanaerobaculia bacterium]|jgi:YVTN family beta-propeller protein
MPSDLLRNLLFAFVLVLPASVPAAERFVPGKLPTGEMLLPNGRLLTPTGTQTEVSPYPFALALTPDGKRVVAACTGADDQSLHLLDAATGKLLAKEPVKKSWLGLAIAPDGQRVYLAGAGGKNVLVYRLENDRFAAEEPLSLRRPDEPAKLNATPSGLAISADGKSLWAGRILLNDLVRVDLASRTVAAAVPVGVHPYRPVFSPDGTLLAVANWGAASVTLVDAASGAVVATVKTADHPSDLLFSRDGRTLFVAQSNRNLVAAVDLASRTVARQISVALGPDGPGTPSADSLPDGSTPNALALSPDGRTLYVANADDDAVAVVDVGGDLRAARTRGFIPSGWYPAALALSSDGKTLWVANAKGGWSWSNAVGGPDPTKKGDGKPWKKTRTIPGSVSRIDVPSAKALAAATARAYANRRPGARGAQPVKASAVVPAAPGGASPIQHVVYVIRENRTYDQVLGDLPLGNGDPALTIFGRDVTPNAHALAEEFVLLDNLYCDAEVSADGHNWSMAAYATDFVEKIWPPDYGSKGFDYLFEGNDANAFPTNGYIWDAAAKAGLTLRNYGEFVGVAAEMTPTVLSLSKGMEGALEGATCAFYPGFDMDILDNARVDVFLKEFRGFVKAKEMPRLLIVRLGNDHTAGTKKGERTPRAMVAENDVALGRLVEAISHSPFWKDTAIFVIEDDAQSGSDHVDAHRTVGFVISPYTRRKGFVDSTMYSTVSMLRTMELILGLPPLSQHDASATPMTHAFADAPDGVPFVHRETKIPFYEMNPDGAPMQAEANAWDFTKEDAAPDLALNEAIWKSVRGGDAEMPAPVNAAWVRLRAKGGD